MAHVGAVLGTLLAQVIIARAFGTEGRGIFANAFALVGLLTVSIGTGHELANTYFIGSGKQRVSEAAGSSFLGLLLSMAILSVTTFLIVCFRPSFVEISSNRLIIIAVLGVPVTWASMYLFSLLRGMGRADLAYAYYAVTNLTWPAAIACLYFVFSYKQLEAVFAARLIAMVVSSIYAYWFIVKLNGFLKFSFSWKSFKESMFYGIRQILSKIANPMRVRLEMLIIPMLYVTGSALGLYAQGVALLDRILILPIVVGYVLMGRAAKEPEKSVGTTLSLCRLSFGITLIMGLGIMLLAKPLISILFGTEFVPAVPLMWIIFPGIVLRSIPRVLQNYFQGIGQPGRVSAVFAASSITMLVADILLIKFAGIGIKGAAVGVLLAALVESGAFAYMFKRKAKVGLTELYLIRAGDLVVVKNGLVRLISRNAKS